MQQHYVFTAALQSTEGKFSKCSKFLATASQHTTGDTLPILHRAHNLHSAISTSVECLNKQTEGTHFEHQDEIKAQVHHWVQICPLVCKSRGEITNSMLYLYCFIFNTCMAK